MKNQKIKFEIPYNAKFFKKGQFVRCVNNQHLEIKIDGTYWNDKADATLVVGELYEIDSINILADRERVFIKLQRLPDRTIIDSYHYNKKEK